VHTLVAAPRQQQDLPPRASLTARHEHVERRVAPHTIGSARRRCGRIAQDLFEQPESLPRDFRETYTARRRTIDAVPNIALIETPAFKRLWLGQQGVFGHATGDYSVRRQRALREWLLDRLEDGRYWPEVALTSCARLADRARQDADFMRVAELYRGHPDFDVAAMVAELVEAEAVPFLPVLRYKPSGLEKRRVWERTWELQRQEDAIDARTALPAGHPERLSGAEAKALKTREVGDIPSPPRYVSANFLPGPAWRLRGKLDVPKERFISYPHCSRAADPSLVVAWAGWDHLQQARALAARYIRMRNEEGWSPVRRSSPASVSWSPGCTNGTTTSTRSSTPAWATTSPISSRRNAARSASPPSRSPPGHRPPAARSEGNALASPWKARMCETDLDARPSPNLS